MEFNFACREFEEGKEPFFFWEILGGRNESERVYCTERAQNSEQHFPQISPALFKCKRTEGNFEFELVEKICMQALEQEHPLLLGLLFTEFHLAEIFF